VSPNDVLAVVVSYDGGQKTRETMDALRRQVGHTLIVDNGSGAESLAVLETLAREEGVTVVRLGQNRGVGHALNLGVARAKEMGFSWLLTMDQDSVVDDHLIRAYVAAVAEDPKRVCLAPRIAGRPGHEDASGHDVAYAITSGNIVRVDLFDRIGLYDEGFFVDCIDFDFCLRVRKTGAAVYLASNAMIRHQLGDAVDAPAIVRRFYARHSPVRRYYMYRNFLYLTERHVLSFPMFIMKLGLLQLVLLPLIGLFDTNRLASYGAVLRGVSDYILHRTGPYVERTR